MNANKRTIALAAAGIVLFVYISFLLGFTYFSQKELYKAGLRQLKDNSEKKAFIAENFLLQYKKDIIDLSRSREVALFFENKALGMSMAYGLRASLVNMDQRFRQTFEQNRAGTVNPYKSICFVDLKSKKSFVSVSAENFGDFFVLMMNNYSFPTTKGISLTALNYNSTVLVIISYPYYFKESFKGFIVAVLCGEKLEHIFKAEDVNSIRLDYIDYGIRYMKSIPSLKNGELFSCMDVQIYNELKTPYIFDALFKDDSTVSMVAIKNPIHDTPFFVVSLLSSKEAFGLMKPWHLLVSMGVLAVVIFVVIVMVLRFSTQFLILETRVKEEEHAKLMLEKLVAQRTKELEDAQDELVNKAIEAGRAQLSAMVLHNIGNAITPINITFEDMNTKEQHKMVEFIGKCCTDIKDNYSDPDYCLPGARGESILNYLDELVVNFKKDLNKKDDIIKVINNNLNYITEILTMQQTCAATEQEVKSQCDLNELMETALTMQIKSLEKRDIGVTREYFSEIPSFVIDRNRLLQVIVNFIKNAYEAMDAMEDKSTDAMEDKSTDAMEDKSTDAMEDKSTDAMEAESTDAMEAESEKAAGEGGDNLKVTRKILTVRTFINKKMVGFEIEDNGIGVMPDKIDTIFEFGESGRGSSGFGLYYCKMFVEKNRGNLGITSQGMGKGAKVRVEFNTA
ncbi:MAG: ATP-binding protein [Thermodesulfobacteriota bacterium]|nr:ATP-binding protein [Thermodesulfobacteriota bacterium]